MKPLPLNLDYLPPSRWRTWTGWLLLICGVALGFQLLVYQHNLTERLEATEFRLNQLKRRMMATSEVAAAATSNANSTYWDSFFSALEAAGDDSVTLLSLAPDTKSLQITGEAKDLASVLDYLRRLRFYPHFAQLRLTEHTVVQEHPRHPLRFTLSLDPTKEVSR